jgi:unsaturated chondroitin disaccharide hydrolase
VTRGLAWAILGFAEELEFIDQLGEKELEPMGEHARPGGSGKAAVIAMMRRAAQVTSEFWLQNTASDGIPYWDTGAPALERLGDWRERPGEPFNDFEPVDSSAAAIACQGLTRFGAWLRAAGHPSGERLIAAGLSLLARLLEEPYLSSRDEHQGLLLHSVYHRPNGWDHVPPGRKVPCGESSMWGDYHLREAALHAQRLLGDGTPLMFWTGASPAGRKEP